MNVATALLAAIAAELLANPQLERLGANGQLENWSLPKHYRAVRGEGLSSTQGIVYENTSVSNYYALAAQSVEVTPGRAYRVSVQAKSNLVRGNAHLCFEWLNADGGYAGGRYANLSSAQNDGQWHRITLVTPRMPAGTTRASIALYGSQGALGKACWDDPSVTPVTAEPLADLHCDAYRNTAADDDRDVCFRAVLNLADADLKPADVIAAFAYPGADGKTRTAEAAQVTPTLATITLPVREIAGGTVHFVLARRSDRARLGEKSLAFRRIGAHPTKGVRIDGRNRLIVDGKPFFPIGMYWSSVNEKDLDTYVKGGPFNCLMPYEAPSKAMLDACDRRKLKVAFSVKDIYPFFKKYASRAEADGAVAARLAYAKGHPATLCYYINDETGVDKMPELVHRYEQVKALDPDHPTWAVIYQFDEMRAYLPSSDAFGSDPYPNGNWEFGKCHQWVRTQCEQCFGARPQWQAVQVMDHGAYMLADRAKAAKTHVLTEEETRNMTWQILVAGADGVFFYSHFDLKRMDWKTPFDESFGRVCRLAKELKGYERFFLSDDPSHILEGLPKGVGAKLWRCGGEYLLAIVNSEWKPAKVSLELGAPLRVVATDLGKPLAAADGRIEAEFDAIGYSILRLR